MRKAGSLSLAFLALAGSCFCLFSLWDTSGIFCLNTGCTIYKEYEIFGISFYWVGIFYFGFLAVIAFVGARSFWLRVFTLPGLLGSILFLFYQVLYWPCSSCLVVAAFLGFFAFSLFRRAGSGWRVVFTVWLLFFAGALLGAIRDGVQPTPLFERENPEVTVFFSAGCPACRHLVETLVSDEALFEKTVLYPVLKSKGDLGRIVFLKKMLDDGAPSQKAFQNFWDVETSPSPSPSLSLREIFTHGPAYEKNKMIFAKFGGDRIPLVLSGNFVRVENIPSISVPRADSGGCSFSSEGSGSCAPEGSGVSSPKGW